MCAAPSGAKGARCPAAGHGGTGPLLPLLFGLCGTLLSEELHSLSKQGPEAAHYNYCTTSLLLVHVILLYCQSVQQQGGVGVNRRRGQGGDEGELAVYVERAEGK